jgi:hypothetical protein
MFYRANFYVVFFVVKNQAGNIGVWKEGMELEAKYVRRKELIHFLPAEVLGKTKRVRVLLLFCT